MINVSIDLNLFKRAITKGAGKVVKAVSHDFVARIIESFRGAKSGRFYPLPPPSRGKYRASARGETPAIRTTRLLRSIRESFPSPLTAEVTINTPYAAILESPAELDRPYVRPAIETVTRRFNSGARARFS